MPQTNERQGCLPWAASKHFERDSKRFRTFCQSNNTPPPKAKPIAFPGVGATCYFFRHFNLPSFPVQVFQACQCTPPFSRAFGGSKNETPFCSGCPECLRRWGRMDAYIVHWGPYHVATLWGYCWAKSVSKDGGKLSSEEAHLVSRVLAWLFLVLLLLACLGN